MKVEKISEHEMVKDGHPDNVEKSITEAVQHFLNNMHKEQGIIIATTVILEDQQAEFNLVNCCKTLDVSELLKQQLLEHLTKEITKN